MFHDAYGDWCNVNMSEKKTWGAGWEIGNVWCEKKHQWALTLDLCLIQLPWK
jgi:hypothetical protein